MNTNETQKKWTYGQIGWQQVETKGWFHSPEPRLIYSVLPENYITVIIKHFSSHTPPTSADNSKKAWWLHNSVISRGQFRFFRLGAYKRAMSECEISPQIISKELQWTQRGVVSRNCLYCNAVPGRGVGGRRAGEKAPLDPKNKLQRLLLWWATMSLSAFLSQRVITLTREIFLEYSVSPSQCCQYILLSGKDK